MTDNNTTEQEIKITNEEEKAEALQRLQEALDQTEKQKLKTKDLESELEEINKRAIEIKNEISEINKASKEEKKKLDKLVAKIKDELASYEISHYLDRVA